MSDSDDGSSGAPSRHNVSVVSFDGKTTDTEVEMDGPGLPVDKSPSIEHIKPTTEGSAPMALRLAQARAAERAAEQLPAAASSGQVTPSGNERARAKGGRRAKDTTLGDVPTPDEQISLPGSQVQDSGGPSGGDAAVLAQLMRNEDPTGRSSGSESSMGSESGLNEQVERLRAQVNEKLKLPSQSVSQAQGSTVVGPANTKAAADEPPPVKPEAPATPEPLVLASPIRDVFAAGKKPLLGRMRSKSSAGNPETPPSMRNALPAGGLANFPGRARGVKDPHLLPFAPTATSTGSPTGPGGARMPVTQRANTNDSPWRKGNAAGGASKNTGFAPRVGVVAGTQDTSATGDGITTTPFGRSVNRTSSAPDGVLLPQFGAFVPHFGSDGDGAGEDVTAGTEEALVHATSTVAQEQNRILAGKQGSKTSSSETGSDAHHMLPARERRASSASNESRQSLAESLRTDSALSAAGGEADVGSDAAPEDPAAASGRGEAVAEKVTGFSLPGGGSPANREDRTPSESEVSEHDMGELLFTAVVEEAASAGTADSQQSDEDLGPATGKELTAGPGAGAENLRRQNSDTGSRISSSIDQNWTPRLVDDEDHVEVEGEKLRDWRESRSKSGTATPSRIMALDPGPALAVLGLPALPADDKREGTGKSKAQQLLGALPKI